WANSEQIKGDVAARISELKAGTGSELKVIGSGNLARTLFRHDLADEILLMIFPVILGNGKRLFGEDAVPASFTLTEHLVATNGVIYANYKKAGEVKTGTIGA